MPKRGTKELFIEQSRIKHGNKYDYSLVDYINNHTKVMITCPIHGVFEQTPSMHFSYGCSKCGYDIAALKRRYTNDFIIEKATEVHGNRYDYTELDEDRRSNKLKIICREHGLFYQSFHDHVKMVRGCSRCKGGIKISQEQFILNVTEIHRGKYDYSKVNYINWNTKVEIVCLEHGSFWQTPNNHRRKGCPVCNMSKGELIIIDLLNKLIVPFEKQKRFDNCRDILPLPFDFYLSEYNTCIEYDGKQHFVPVFGKEVFKKTVLHDNIKSNFCKENNINLIRINNWSSIEPTIINVLFPICI